MSQGLVADNVPVSTQYIALLAWFRAAVLSRLFLMVNPESSDSPQIKLIRECSRGFQTRDPNLIAKALHKDFRNVPYPRSLGWPEQTKEEFLEQYVGMSNLWAADPEVSYIGYSIGPLRRD
jgi:hypothetical protein